MIPQNELSGAAQLVYGTVIEEIKTNLRKGEYGFSVAFFDQSNGSLQAVFYRLVSEVGGIKKYDVVEIGIMKLHGAYFQVCGKVIAAIFVAMDIVDMADDEFNPSK